MEWLAVAVQKVPGHTWGAAPQLELAIHVPNSSSEQRVATALLPRQTGRPPGGFELLEAPDLLDQLGQ